MFEFKRTKLLLDRVDRKLCLNLLPIFLRVWWCRLWIRKSEFHPAHDIDSDVLLHLNMEKAQQYRDDVTRRRNIAHEHEDQQQNSKEDDPLKNLLSTYRPSKKVREQIRRDMKGVSRDQMPDITL